MPKILLVEDEASLAETISYNLREEGYKVHVVSDGLSALDSIRTEKFDLILLDIMLPGMDGLDITRILRQDMLTAHIPIIMLTARVEETDRLIGLELGADDYITKPFSPRELVARVRAVLRRSEGALHPTRIINAGELIIDLERRTVRRGQETIDLTATEFDLLAILASAPGR
ncbi:MAG: response regulator transcription factor, partial [Armatimonadetes bacterium]|nr:response regulator transcription factor [Armatimonadota bacterium]